MQELTYEERGHVCASHKAVGYRGVPATHRSDNPAYSRFYLCKECAELYDSYAEEENVEKG